MSSVTFTVVVCVSVASLSEQVTCTLHEPPPRFSPGVNVYVPVQTSAGPSPLSTSVPAQVSPAPVRRISESRSSSVQVMAYEYSTPSVPVVAAVEPIDGGVVLMHWMVNVCVSLKAGAGVPSSVTITPAVHVSDPPHVQLTTPVTLWMLTTKLQVSPERLQVRPSAGTSGSVASAS